MKTSMLFILFTMIHGLCHAFIPSDFDSKSKCLALQRAAAIRCNPTGKTDVEQKKIKQCIRAYLTSEGCAYHKPKARSGEEPSKNIIRFLQEDLAPPQAKDFEAPETKEEIEEGAIEEKINTDEGGD